MEPNLNINDLINELRGLYDVLKSEKSQLNRKIRTLNSAYSRKNRKISEADTYSDKAEGIKNSLITSTRNTFNDITSSTELIERTFTDVKKRIDSIVNKGNLLRDRGDLTMSQSANFELFDEFSNQIIEYYDNNINELKNYKYEGIRSFLEEELSKNNESLFTESDFHTKKLFPAAFKFGKMLELAHEWKTINSEFKNAMSQLLTANSSMSLALNIKVEEMTVLENLAQVSLEELNTAIAELDAAIQNGASPEEIETLNKAKEDKQVKRNGLLEQKSLVEQQIGEVSQDLYNNGQEQSQTNNYYTQLLSTIYSQIQSYKSEFESDLQTIWNESSNFFVTTGGKRIWREIFGWILVNINNAQSPFNDQGISNLRDITNSGISEELGYRHTRDIYTRVIESQNSNLFEGLPDFKRLSPLAKTDWANRWSFALDGSFYNNSITFYLNKMESLAQIKGAAEKLQEFTSEVRLKLDDLYNSKNAKQDELESLNNEKVSLDEEIDGLYSQIQELQAQISELDTNDPGYLDSWESLKDEVRLLELLRNERFNERNNKASLSDKKRMFIIDTIDPKISDLESKISSMDNEIRDKFASVEQLEDQIRDLLQYVLNPQNGDLINSLKDNEKAFSFFTRYSDSLGQAPEQFHIINMFRNAVISSWDEFVESDFGYLMILLSCNGSPNYDNSASVLSYTEGFIINSIVGQGA